MRHLEVPRSMSFLSGFLRRRVAGRKFLFHFSAFHEEDARLGRIAAARTPRLALLLALTCMRENNDILGNKNPCRNYLRIRTQYANRTMYPTTSVAFNCVIRANQKRNWRGLGCYTILSQPSYTAFRAWVLSITNPRAVHTMTVAHISVLRINYRQVGVYSCHSSIRLTHRREIVLLKIYTKTCWNG